jgi:hypothetical protein
MLNITSKEIEKNDRTKPKFWESATFYIQHNDTFKQNQEK